MAAAICGHDAAPRRATLFQGLRDYLLLGGLLLCLCAPALAQETLLDRAHRAVEREQFEIAAGWLQTWLEDYPEDQEARFLYARVLSWSARRAEALRQYDLLLETGPDNVDYLLGKAQTLVWDERPLGALPLLERARALAPHYEALWRVELQALLAVGDDEHHQRAEGLAAEASERFPESNWEVPPPRVAPAIVAAPDRIRGTQVEVGGSYDWLTDGYDDWRSVYVEAEHQLDVRKLVYGRARGTDRYDQDDHEFTLGGYAPLSPRWTAAAEGTYSASHDVLPVWSVMGQLQWSLPKGWGTGAGIRHSEYRPRCLGVEFETDSDLLWFTLDRYWGNYYAGYTLYRAEADDSDQVYSNRFALNRYYGDRSWFGLSFSRGEEIENSPIEDFGGFNCTPTLVTSDVTAAVLAGRHWLRPRWAISYQFGYFDYDIRVREQRPSYTRTGIRVGLRYRY